MLAYEASISVYILLYYDIKAQHNKEWEEKGEEKGRIIWLKGEDRTGKIWYTGGKRFVIVKSHDTAVLQHLALMVL